MDDVGQDIARAKLEASMKAAQSRREIVMAEILKGTSLEYLSLRYSIELSKLVYAKSVLLKRAEKAEQLKQRGTA